MHESDFRLPRSRPANYIAYSMFGLISIYNLLPAQIVETSADVGSFQAKLQDMLVKRADSAEPDWKYTYSPMIEMRTRPLRHII